MSTYSSEPTSPALSSDVPNPQDQEVLEQVNLERIDTDIAKYEILLSALKSERNTYAPISRLPPELMSRIFSLVKAHYIKAHFQEKIKQNCLQWVGVSQVSRQWRSIALQSSVLWAEMPLAHTRWVEEMLTRSKMASLVVDSAFWKIEPEGLDLVLEHASRIKDLSIGRLTFTQRDFLEDRMPIVTPRLEILRLSLYPFDIEGLYEHDDNIPRIDMSDNIFCNTDKLRRLELIGCRINWSSQLLRRSLTHLRLEELGEDGKPTSSQFVDILTTLASTLESLVLENVLPIIAPADLTRRIGRRNLIHFDRLQNLDIFANAPEVDGLLLRITFPCTATVAITAYDNRLFCGGGCKTLLSGLERSFCATASRTEFQTLTICRLETGIEADGVQLQFYKEDMFKADFLPVLPNGCPQLLLRLSWKHGPTATNCNQTLADVFTSQLPLYNIVSMELWDLFSSVEHADITGNVFFKLPEVRSIRTLGEHNVNSVIHALRVSEPSNFMKLADPATQPMCFPKISSLYISEAEFVDSDRDKEQEGQLNGDLELVSLESLRDCLIHRYEVGAEIERLVIQDYYDTVTRRDLVLLREVVANVDWLDVSGEVHVTLCNRQVSSDKKSMVGDQ